jgi:hypothetical protein
MLRLARRKIEAKHVENVAETGEYVLAETLLRIVREDGSKRGCNQQRARLMRALRSGNKQVLR